MTKFVTRLLVAVIVLAVAFTVLPLLVSLSHITFPENAVKLIGVIFVLLAGVYVVKGEAIKL